MLIWGHQPKGLLREKALKQILSPRPPPFLCSPLCFLLSKLMEVGFDTGFIIWRKAENGCGRASKGFQSTTLAGWQVGNVLRGQWLGLKTQTL